MNGEILFAEHDENLITDNPHCSDCRMGSELTDKPHCSDCRMGSEVTDKPHCSDCQT